MAEHLANEAKFRRRGSNFVIQRIMSARGWSGHDLFGQAPWAKGLNSAETKATGAQAEIVSSLKQGGEQPLGRVSAVEHQACCSCPRDTLCLAPAVQPQLLHFPSYPLMQMVKALVSRGVRLALGKYQPPHRRPYIQKNTDSRSRQPGYLSSAITDFPKYASWH